MDDATGKKEQQLLQLLDAARSFINFSEGKFDSQRVCDDMRILSGAKSVGFNLFDEDGLTYTTVALSGMNRHWQKIINLLGFNPIGKKWNARDEKNQLTQDRSVTVFNHLHELTGSVLPSGLMKLFESMFGLGPVVILRVIKDHTNLGDFTLFLRKGQTLDHTDVVELYASLTGLFIEKAKAEQRVAHILESTNAGTWVWNVQTGLMTFNEQWAFLLGYSLSELLPTSVDTWRQLMHPEDAKRSEQLLKSVFHREVDFYSGEYRMRHKAGHWVWVLVRGKVMSWTADDRPLMMFGTQLDITESKVLQEEIRISEERHRIILEGSYDIVYRVTPDGLFQYLSPAWQKLLGFSAEEVMGKSFHPFIHPDDLPMIIDFFNRAAQTGTRQSVDSYRIRHADGSWHWYTSNAMPIIDEKGEVSGFAGTARDITQRKEMEKQLLREKELFRTTLMSVGDGVIATDRLGHITVMNQIAEKLTGWDLEQAIGQSLDHVLCMLKEHSRLPVLHLAEDVIRTGESQELEHLLLLSRDKNEIPIEFNISPIQDQFKTTTGAVVVLSDYTVKYEKLKKVKYFSFHDHLTGLYNRRYLEDSLRRLDTKRNLPLAIILLDINGLKLTNDAFGHEEGDKLLIRIAEILTKICRADDIVCRAGGDEFTVLLPNTDQERARSIIDRILAAAAAQPLDSVVVSVAAGFAVKTLPDQSVDHLLKEADRSMYKNKLQYGRMMRTETINRIMQIIQARREDEYAHAQAVSRYCVSLARALKLDEKRIDDASQAGYLHDIGKISLPVEILKKTKALTPEETEIMQRHPITGYQILKSVEEYTMLAESVFHHHEAYDGSGYPQGIEGESIPLLSRIIAIADAYDRLRTVHDKSNPEDSVRLAVQELIKSSGSKFDPELVDVFAGLQNVT